MSKFFFSTWAGAASVALMIVAGPAFAGDEREQDPFAQWTNLQDAELSQSSGGASLDLGDIGLNIATNRANVSGNSVDGNVNTGQISNNALEDVSGINSLMFNTGNNVNFQSNMQVNIFLR